jgi:hypothetical protein
MNDESLTNIDVVLYVLFQLGGATKKIHTEEVAWEAYQLSKEKFSWTLNKFKQKGFPDKTTARYALETAKKLNFVIGRAGRDKSGNEKEGWQLTPNGLNWIVQRQSFIAKSLKAKNYLHSTLNPQEKRLASKIKNHKSFMNYKQKGSLDDISDYDFIDMLDCSPNASNRVIKIKFNSLKNLINLLNDNELKNFIENMEHKFSNLLIA